MFRRQLAERTADLHRAAEAVVPLMRSGVTIDDYRQYLRRWTRFVVRAESGLQRAPGLRRWLPDLDERWKTPRLLHDCERLGVAVRAGADPGGDPPTDAVAFGQMYVLEGSTLGGQVILRHLRRTLGDAIDGATRSLDAYGRHTGRRWQAFQDGLEAFVDTCGDHEIVVTAARDTFHEFLRAYAQPRRTYPSARVRTSTARPTKSETSSST